MIDPTTITTEMCTEGVRLPVKPPLDKDGKPLDLFVSTSGVRAARVYAPDGRSWELAPGGSAHFEWKGDRWERKA